MLEGTPEQRLATLADAQRGRVSRAQLLAIGMSDWTIRRHLRQGALRPRHRGIYAVGHNAPVPLSDETAALLACGTRAALSGRTVLYLQGMIPTPPPEVHVVLLNSDYAKSRPGIRVHRSRSLTPDQLTTLKGLPATTPARALLELADDCTPRELERAHNEGLVLRKLSQTKVRQALDSAGKGRAGAAKLRELTLPNRPRSITDSEAEERLLELLRKGGIRPPQMQVPLHGYIADFYWPGAAYVVEFDGYQAHSTRRAFHRDRTKSRVLARHHILVDRFTWEDITTGQLKTVAHIAATLAERTRRTG